jgi:glutamyl/glutaminyl-tRNA synthetase
MVDSRTLTQKLELPFGIGEHSIVHETYRGRLAPSPTGLLHLGHARTFWIAHQRARAAGGVVVLRNDDLDRSRVKAEFVQAFFDDLRWLGLRWEEGPDLGGPFAPYNQSERPAYYREALEELKARDAVYPCTCSRQDVLRAIQAPHAGEEEPIYPGTCRGRRIEDIPPASKVNWRFRVPDGAAVQFEDLSFGPQAFEAGRQFGDFVVWRGDGLPAYQLACVVDDDAMQISEVVRGADLLLSTARQLLLYEALGMRAPAFYHCPLMLDERGQRLAKRHDALSLRALRSQGKDPRELIAGFATPRIAESRASP